MADNVEWLQRWCLRMEHERPGDRPIFAIESLSTSGWLVRADLRDFGWDASRSHVPRADDDGDGRWVSTSADGPVLTVYCGPLCLDRAVGIVRHFILDEAAL